MSTAGATRQPTLFIPHGAGPCFFMDWTPADTWTGMAAFLGGLVDTLPARPTGIVLVSAHWLADAFSVTSGARPDLIYDYRGFPPHTYGLTYPAPGDPALAAQVAAALESAGLPVRRDDARGFDHGMFIPLKVMRPEADIPVVQLSLRRDLDPAEHLAAGRALAGLRDQGVLIVGSGMSFHNMRGYGDPAFGPVSDRFDAWLSEAVEAPDEERGRRLRAWESAPAARASHPPGGEEHLIPLMVAAGAADGDPGRTIYSERVMETTLSAFRFG